MLAIVQNFVSLNRFAALMLLSLMFAPSARADVGDAVTVEIPYMITDQVLDVTLVASGGLFGLRLFMNLPSANLNTSISDPHYVVSLAFYPVLNEENLAAYRYMIPVHAVFERIAGEIPSQGNITITVVLLPRRDSKGDSNIVFHQIEFRQ